MTHPVGVTETTPRIVLFVCLHGAYRSRLAAAFFNAAAPPGWQPSSAGIEPQEAISGSALELVEGTPGQAHLEQVPPRAIADAGRADRTVAIDCDVPGADRWVLDTAAVGADQRDEIRARAERLAAELSAG